MLPAVELYVAVMTGYGHARQRHLLQAIHCLQAALQCMHASQPSRHSRKADGIDTAERIGIMDA